MLVAEMVSIAWKPFRWYPVNACYKFSIYRFPDFLKIYRFPGIRNYIDFQELEKILFSHKIEKYIVSIFFAWRFQHSFLTQFFDFQILGKVCQNRQVLYYSCVVPSPRAPPFFRTRHLKGIVFYAVQDGV